MNRPLMCCVLTALLLALAPPVIGGENQQAASLSDAISKGTPLLSFRYRYEEVGQNNFDKNAHASTLRTTVGYRSLTYRGFSFLVEAENVTVIGDDAYDNKGYGALNNGVTDRPGVADPAFTEFNQAYFQWRNSAHTNKAQVGREEIIIGDARFVGNVVWRQNHQSFDAFTFTNSSLDILDWSYRYLNRVNRIYGSMFDMASHLINADLKLGKAGKLALYGYLLDYTQTDNYKLSTSTWGAEFSGRYELGEGLALLYEVEYAQQTDYADNPGNIDAEYYFLMLGGVFEPVTVKAGYEVLGGNLEDGQFNTPLATLFKFNGWADQFLSTPTPGLDDLYLQLNGKLGPVKLLAAYHLFQAYTGGATHGREFDVRFTYTASWKQSFGLQGAFYNADEHKVDTKKIWVFTSYKI